MWKFRIICTTMSLLQLLTNLTLATQINKTLSGMLTRESQLVTIHQTGDSKVDCHMNP